jgi:hypothetical protein
MKIPYEPLLVQPIVANVFRFFGLLSRSSSAGRFKSVFLECSRFFLLIKKNVLPFNIFFSKTKMLKDVQHFFFKNKNVER